MGASIFAHNVLLYALNNARVTHSFNGVQYIEHFRLLIGFQLVARYSVRNIVDKGREEGDLKILIKGNQLESCKTAVGDFCWWRCIGQLSVCGHLDRSELRWVGTGEAIVCGCTVALRQGGGQTGESRCG